MVLVAGLIAIFAISSNMSPEESKFTSIEPAAGSQIETTITEEAAEEITTSQIQTISNEIAETTDEDVHAIAEAIEEHTSTAEEVVESTISEVDSISEIATSATEEAIEETTENAMDAIEEAITEPAAGSSIEDNTVDTTGEVGLIH